MVTSRRKDDVMARFLTRKPHLLRVVVAVLICCLAGATFCATGFSAPAPAPEAANLTTQQKQELVRQAVAAYERGDQTKAQQSLERAKTVFPENYAVPYYLGLIYLQQGRRSDAIAQWQQYIAMDPNSENAVKIRKNLTLLLRQEAQEFAKQAVAEQASLVKGKVDDKTVAVTSFSYLGSQDLGPLGKGMAAMLISDLSKIPDLKVVDRIRLQALLEEMKLGGSGLVDPKTAPKVGKLLKARHVTSGSLADLDKQSLVIASVVVDAHRKAGIVSSQDAQGALKEFYDLEKNIACQIVQALGKNCETVPGGFYIIHTKSLPALVLYSRGLDEFDKENYDEARSMFQKSLDEDPKFDLALVALLATPTSAMLLMSYSQMASTAASSGPSPATAGSAVAKSTAGSAATASGGSTGAGALGLSPTALTVAGVAAVGGALALSGGGGGGGGEEKSSPPPEDLSGIWRGTWTDNTDGTSGEATFTLAQTGSALSGTVSVAGDTCLPQGNVSGTVSGNSVNLTIQSSAESVTLSATYNATAKTLTGTWNYSASASTDCMGDIGSFTGTLTGGADITW
jgi:tetratricopeptide (TPR) repeat protein